MKPTFNWFSFLAWNAFCKSRLNHRDNVWESLRLEAWHTRENAKHDK